jgi:phosphoglycerate dehydrogenase-like enzyme
VRDQVARRWNTDHQYDELSGKRALIVGAGGIGRALARRLDAFEVEVHAVDLRPQEPDAHIREIRPIEDLLALLPRTDILAICCPLTAATRHLIDATALVVLPDDAYLVNISRGPVVSTEALVASLTAGRLRGVGLDVVEGEPLPPEHPLWQFSNVIITPHVGGRSPQRQRRLLEFVGENLERYKNGRPLLNVVDRAAGF